MAVKSKPQRKEPEKMESFDVTCTIGTVFLGNGEESPHVAAFKLIAMHDTPGTYRFPMGNGGTVVVDVEYENEPCWCGATGSEPHVRGQIETCAHVDRREHDPEVAAY